MDHLPLRDASVDLVVAHGIWKEEAYCSGRLPSEATTARRSSLA